MARNWAITIGINGYRYLQRLHYAMSDANAVRQFFSQELGFHQVYHFSDDSPPIAQDYGPDLESEPTSTTLSRFLRTRFEQPFLRDGDNLWFFFAGHGIRHENRDYLMPIDGDRGDLERSAIPLHYVSERLRCSGADNVIMLIDACRSDEGRRDGLGFSLEKQQGVITLFSCSPEESAYEIAELKQGAFTHVLLESLRLQGEGNCATVERLYQRLRYDVPQLTRKYKRVAQTPYGVIEPPSKNHLILLPKQATLTDVVALKNDALTAEVDHNPKTAKQLWIRVLMVSPGDPAAIAGIERLSRGEATVPPTKPPAPPLSAPAAVAPRSATPISPPPASSPRPNVSHPIPPPKSQSPSPPRPANIAASASPPTQRRPPSARQSQRMAAPAVTRKTTLDALGEQISRRRVIQILGFAGGGILLGRALLGSNDRKLPVLEPATVNGATTDWKLPVLAPATVNGTTAEFNVATVNVTDRTINVERQQAEFRTEQLGDDITLDLMVLPSGTFTMGSPAGQGHDDEKPQHEVTVTSFLMGKYLVTQAQWKAVVAMTKVAVDLDTDPSNFKGDNRPVERVSWDDAIEFCQRLSQHSGREYRLPSEAEWEYACRAGTPTPFHYGETLTAELANYRASVTYGDGPTGEYRGQTTDVGSFPANGFGLYDLHGNVWEWCLDHWHDNYKGAPTDSSAWIEDGKSSYRVLRGGSWFNLPDNCRSAVRNRFARVYRYNFFGFRVVCAASWTL